MHLRKLSLFGKSKTQVTCRKLSVMPIRSLTLREASLAARTTDAKGLLPIDYVMEAQASDHGKRELRDNLFHLMQSYSLPPITTPILSSEISRDSAAANDELRHNLERGRQVANKVRSKIQFSSSHTDANQVTREEQRKYADTIAEIRKPFIGQKLDMPVFAGITTLSEDYKTANCDEASLLSLKYLLADCEVPLSAVIYSSSAGHTLMAFDTNPMHTPQSLYAQSRSAVFVDSWAGSVGRFDPLTLYQQGTGYKQYFLPSRRLLNVVTKLNSDYHHFSPIFAVRKSDKGVEMTSMQRIRLFYRATPETPTDPIPHPVPRFNQPRQ